MNNFLSVGFNKKETLELQRNQLENFNKSNEKTIKKIKEFSKKTMKQKDLTAEDFYKIMYPLVCCD